MSTSRPITSDEHVEIMKTMSETHIGIRPNPEIVHILTIECSTGLRLSDILSMKLSDFYLTDSGYRLKIREQKTGKERNVPIPLELHHYISEYAIAKGRRRDEKIFKLTPRAVTKYIKKVADYLGLENVSSHSWRKLYALSVYEKTGNDIVAVQQALLHSSLTLWKRVRKYGAFATGITQNVDDLLQSHTARTMLANSEFIIMLNQASTDRIKLAELLNISDLQMSYITNVEAGHGLIKVGSSLVPFANKFPKNTKLYKLMTTKPGESA